MKRCMYVNIVVLLIVLCIYDDGANGFIFNRLRSQLTVMMWIIFLCCKKNERNEGNVCVAHIWDDICNKR